MRAKFPVALLVATLVGVVGLAKIERVVEVGYEEARETMLKLAREEGVLGGLSTGANVAVALEVAERLEKGAVVTLAPDSIFRYTHLL